MQLPDKQTVDDALSSELVILASRGVFFHGGNPALSVGETLLPASLTGQDPRKCGKANIVRTENVFVTPHLHAAALYAKLAGGRVYVVRPLGCLAVAREDILIIQLLRHHHAPLQALWKTGPKNIAAAMFPTVMSYTCKSALIVGIQGAEVIG